jgi:translocation and assembly module TamB
VTAPEILGTFRLMDGGLVVVPTAQRFEDVELAGEVDREALRIDRLSVASGGGTASGSGTVEFGTVGGLGGTFHLESDEFPLSGEGAVLGRLSCELDVSAAVLTAPHEATGARRVDGHVDVGRCTLVLPRQRSQAVMGMEDHPDFRLAGREEARAAAESGEPSSPWDMTVTVDVPGEFSVRREDLQLTGTGNLVYRSTPSQGEAASVGGSIEMRRGWADLFGKRFDLDFGDVDFTGRDPIDGTIDLRLVADTTEGPVYVDVTGTLRHPAVQLTSDPPRDQSEILALLFLGRTDTTSQEQLAIGERSASAAVAQDVVTTVGLAYFQSQVASRISPLTVFRIDPGAQGLEDARLRAGVNVLSNLYVEYSYQFAADELQNKNEGRIEWLILRNLSLEGNFGDAQAGGIHLQFRTEW